MADELTVDDKKYISSKRAAETSGYAQDYIGQLARSGQIDAQRIGGLWFISMDSLMAYKSKAEAFKPQQPAPRVQNEPDSIISLDGRDYVSAARAADISGYHQDYVGQLAREGKVLSRQVGSRWYVERAGVLAHKKEKDGLLAAVQTEAVGIFRPATGTTTNPESLSDLKYQGAGPYLTYTNDEGDLLPLLPKKETLPAGLVSSKVTDLSPSHTVPIRVLRANSSKISDSAGVRAAGLSQSERVPQIRGTGLPLLLPAGAAIATIVIVLTIGYAWPGSKAIYTQINPLSSTAASALVDNGFAAVKKIGDILEGLIVPEVVFKRANDFSL